MPDAVKSISGTADHPHTLSALSYNLRYASRTLTESSLILYLYACPVLYS